MVLHTTWLTALLRPEGIDLQHAPHHYRISCCGWVLNVGTLMLASDLMTDIEAPMKLTGHAGRDEEPTSIALYYVRCSRVHHLSSIWNIPFHIVVPLVSLC